MKALQDLLDSVFVAYSDDPSAPGVVTSRITRRGETVYYASVVRYKARLGEGKRVLVRVVGAELEQAITELSRAFEIFRDSELTTTPSEPVTPHAER